MEVYENMDNIRQRGQKIRVDIQLGKYKAHLISKQNILGTVYGFDLLSMFADNILDDLDSYEQFNCKIELLDEDDDNRYWYRIIFLDDEGNELNELEDYCDNFENLIVGTSIYSCEIIEN